jgi:MerR family transcriptional regulator, light-induced transcriptional regulator
VASYVPVTMAGSMADGLSIKEVAEQTGLAPGTIRMWEQRYCFPAPRRTASGYRRYEPEDVETLRRGRGHPQRRVAVNAVL